MARGRLFQPRATGSIRSSPATYLAVQTCRANKYEASMDAAWQVIANAGPPRPVPWHLGFLWLTLALAAVILLGALVIAWLDRWRRRSNSERLSANDQLANFRDLYDKGQLSQEEFERIRALLSRELRCELDVPAAPPGTASGQAPEAAKSTEQGQPPA